MTRAAGPLRIVLVGTGTSVGKTWLGCSLLRELKNRGTVAVGLKPVESGVVDAGTDGAQLAALSATAPSEPPYQFVEPLSPHLAARRAGASIELPRLLRYVQHHESGDVGPVPSVVIVETAGGLFSPLGEGLTNWDFAHLLDPARWVLVASDSLGVLHDVTATMLAAHSRGRAPDEVVLCAAREADASSGSNAGELRRLRLAARPFWCRRDDASAVSNLLDDLLTEPPRVGPDAHEA